MKKKNDNKSTLFARKMIYLLLFFTLPVAYAQIAVESLSMEPSIAFPGDQVRLQLSLENVGDEDVENVVVALDLSKVPFAPIGSSTEKIVAEIRDHREKSVVFDLQVLPDAAALVYKIPVTITDGTMSKTSLIGVTVQAKAHLDQLLDHNSVFLVGQQDKIAIKFVNNGQVQIDFLKVTLQESRLYEILSPSSVYIGEVDLGDFETEEFTIIPMVGDPVLSLQLEYRDPAGEQYRETQLLQLPTYTREEAEKKGLIASQSSPIFIVISIVVIIVLGLLYRKWRRKNHER